MADRNPALEMIIDAKEEFAGDDRPVTVEMLAQVYGPIAGLIDSVISLTSLARKGDNSLGHRDEWDDLEASIRFAVKEVSASLIQLSEGREDTK